MYMHYQAQCTVSQPQSSRARSAPAAEATAATAHETFTLLSTSKLRLENPELSNFKLAGIYPLATT